MSQVTRPWRSSWTGVVVVLVVLLLGSAALVVVEHRHRPAKPVAACQIGDGGSSYALDLAQAANAATIAAVAARLGLSDHAVTVAYATALQESKLRNLSYGDRDSVGLFQQRPSQGWGSRGRILDPRYAADRFYRRLVQIRGWQAMPVAVAAQAVQRSAGGAAYADWEPAARTLALAFTGEVPHGIACSFPPRSTSAPGLDAALRADTGSVAVGVPVAPRVGWRTAAWLVAKAAEYGVDEVDFGGRRWTRSSGRWRATVVRNEVSYALGRR